MPKIKNTIKKQDRKIKKTKNKIRRNNRKIRILRRKVNRVVRRNRGIKYATTKRIRRFNKIMKSSGNSLTVSGQDLVYKIPDKEFIAQDLSDVFCLIPANPAYWKGTRISTLANGYQQYRPIKIIIKYVPSVAANISGNVFIGTLWNSSVIDSQLEQTLPTTPGGLITQCYSPATRRIPLGRNLSQNLYNLSGDLSKDSNPFYIVGIAKDIVKDNVKINPGLIYIQYVYHFKNPINSMVAYRNTGMLKYKDLIFCENTSLVTLKSYTFEVTINNQLVQKTVNSLTQLEVERTPDEGEIVCTYNGSYVPIKDDDVIWAFQNEPVNDGVPQSGQVVPFIKREIPFTHCYMVRKNDYPNFMTGIYPYCYIGIIRKNEYDETQIDLISTNLDPQIDLTSYEPYNNNQDVRYFLTFSPDQLNEFRDLRPTLVGSWYETTPGEYVPGWSRKIYNENKLNMLLRYNLEDSGHSITIAEINPSNSSIYHYPDNPYVPSQAKVLNEQINSLEANKLNKQMSKSVTSKPLVKKEQIKTSITTNLKTNTKDSKTKSRSKSKTKKIIKEEVCEEYPEEDECLTKSELEELEKLDQLEQKGP